MVKTYLAILLLAAAEQCLAAPKSAFAIVHPVFATGEDGPPVATDYQFVPADTIYFSCQAEGYRKVDKPDDYGKQAIHLKYQIEARDAHGILLQPPTEGEVKTDVTSEDKNWEPKFRYKIVVPPLPDPGEYVVLVKLSDEQAKAETELRAPFSVTARNVAPSDTLIVRNFHFLRSEDDPKPLEVAAYRPGDPVWARFDMTGYKFGEKNLVDIEYGLTVLRADGSTAYTQPEAAKQRVQTFYPQRYQPGELSLNLATDQALGKYTIVLTVRDNISHQTYETRQTFSVE
ncbi:MAG TPA: hypothetical protein VMH80_22720 [Bryobacteraceae bacterium]|nr:hypothetical protein [Bryobacteraceae bacterium]